ncbi:MAG: nuclear transport factor 2 family protein [Acetobacteraceae bacterium]
MPANSDARIRHIYDRWHATINSHDLDGVMALYAEHAVLETPAILAMYPDKEEGILRGRGAIEQLFAINFEVLAREFRRLYRSGLFLSNGELPSWVYPRKTPTGDQVDLVESMDIENGLIVYHRVYWGWRGFKALKAAQAKRCA